LKNAAIFLFLVMNGTWFFIAYWLQRIGLPLGLIAAVVAFGAVLGNLAVYAGIRFAAKMFRRSEPR
jgi:hypothetical protein